MNNNSFKQKLKKRMNNFSISFLVGIALAFTILLLLYSYGYSYFRADRYHRELADNIEMVQGSIESYLNDKSFEDDVLEVLKGRVPLHEFAYNLKQTFRPLGLNVETTLTSDDDLIIFTDRTSDWSEQQELFNTYLRHNASPGQLYRTVFNHISLADLDAHLVIARRITDNRGIGLGTVSLFIDLDDYLSKFTSGRYVSVITFADGRVVGTSDRSFVRTHFSPASGRFYNNGETRFWLSASQRPQEGFVCYVLLYDFPITEYFLIGFMLLLFILSIFLILSRILANRIATDNAQSIQTLHAELDELAWDIRHDNRISHQIVLSTGDEIDEIVGHINNLMYEMQTINDRNIELIYLNALMEIRQLEAQFNPHFLYNTLENIRYAVLLGEKGIDEIILKLTELLRYSVNTGDESITVHRDLQYLIKYLEIIQFRYGNRFSYHIQVEEACYKYETPKLLLQPLVENSVKYGFKAKELLRVKIRFFMEGENLIAEVQDNGPGLSSDQLDALRSTLDTEVHDDRRHSALRSLQRRLQIMYGADSGIEIISQAGQGMTVRCQLKTFVRE